MALEMSALPWVARTTALTLLPAVGAASSRPLSCDSHSCCQNVELILLYVAYRYLSKGNFSRDVFLKLGFVHVRPPFKSFMAPGCVAQRPVPPGPPRPGRLPPTSARLAFPLPASSHVGDMAIPDRTYYRTALGLFLSCSRVSGSAYPSLRVHSEVSFPQGTFIPLHGAGHSGLPLPSPAQMPWHPSSCPVLHTWDSLKLFTDPCSAITMVGGIPDPKGAQ